MGSFSLRIIAPCTVMILYIEMAPLLLHAKTSSF
jgi:hypothetical protein